MSNPNDNDRQHRRRMRFEHAYCQLAAQGLFQNRPIRPSIPAEVWVGVAFAVMADFISRAFAWFRILGYLALVGAIYYLAPGAVQTFGLRLVIFDLTAAAALLRSIWLILKRECTY